MDKNFFDKLEQIFLSESAELLANLENDLLSLERNSNNEETIKRILRNVHTLKGSTGMINAMDIAGYIHTFEDVLKYIFKVKIYNTDTFNFLLEHVDYIKNLIDRIVRQKIAADTGQLSENTALLKNYIEKLENFRQENSDEKKPFGFFEEVKKEKKKYSDFMYYRIRFFLNEKRYKNTWYPESIIDDLAAIGRIFNVKAKREEAKISWDNFDWHQCYFSWIIILQTKEPLSAIEDIFLFFRQNNDISIEMLDNQSLTLLGEVLISDGKINQEDIDEALKVNSKLGEALVESKKISESDISDALEKQKKFKNELSIGDEIKISTQKVDRLIDLVGELIIANSNLNSFQKETENEDIEQIQYTINKISKQMRDLILSLKMVPIGQLLARFYRVVRDISKQFDKKITLQIEGENTELDKTMFDILQEPFLHIIRNGLDHGIETPEERLRLGKDETGKITIKSYHENGRIIIEIMDDGRGLDRDKILGKAIEKGLLSVNRDYTEEQIFNIIFEPGFSTKDEANLVSGRGIGMDVVLNGIKRINGEIKTKSIKGKGTNFNIQVPLTLAIIEGFLVRIGSNDFVIPMQFISECFELKKSVTSGDAEEYNLRGEYLTLIDLSFYFEGIIYDVSNASSRQVIVAELNGSKIGIFVDEIIGNMQAVIKPINKLINRSHIITGSTLLGNGEVALIIDIAGLFEKIREKTVH